MLRSDHAKTLEWLGNLNQLLVNLIVHRHLTPEQCRFEERTAKLKEALQAIADDRYRPNNSLEAQADLLRIELNRAMITNEPAALSNVWQAYSVILDKAAGLGEFDADTVIKLIEVAGHARSSSCRPRPLCGTQEPVRVGQDERRHGKPLPIAA